MASFLAPPAYKPEQTGPEADAKYKRLRWQVFIGIFIGYAGFYLVRKNFSMAIPMLEIENSDIRDGISLATRFIYNLVDEEKVKLIFKQDYKRRIAYHTACHMQRMGWQLYSIELLRMIPGLDLQVLEQECCGISGTYGFKKENYERSQAIGSVLFKHIEDAKVEAVTTDCETCKWQIEMSTGLPVENPISVLADALDVEATRRANSI